MNLDNKIVSAHRGFFSEEAEKTYKENSRDVCQIAGQKNYIKSIELDVRKSKDGILYCYHGGLIQFFFSLKIPRTFVDLQKKYGVDSLKDILSVIPENKIVLLDLQDKSITKKDILETLEGKRFKEVILGNPWVSYLERYNDMPMGFVKFMNRNIFANFYNLKKLKRKGYKYHEVLFPFQVTKNLVASAHDNGLGFSCAPIFFLNKDSYWKKINKYNIDWVSSDFI